MIIVSRASASHAILMLGALADAYRREGELGTAAALEHSRGALSEAIAGSAGTRVAVAAPMASGAAADLLAGADRYGADREFAVRLRRAARRLSRDRAT